MTSESTPEFGHLGRYELLARLATGGMGEIFLARLEGAAGFEKLYVIKRILPHLADDPRFRTMLIDEARIASKMSHPNICQVYELGESDGQLFIAMEYLEGVTLLPILRRAAKADKPLALGLVAGIVQQTCDALHYAHELKERDGTPLNVIHRDVTPSNLFATGTGIIKVLDFGIAKVKNASQNTEAGTVKGKYAYMAPEQLRSETITQRVDVFSVAVVVYEMLALRRLFQRKTDYLTFRAVMELPIPNIREFRPDLPPQLGEMMSRALEREPQNRFASARQLASAFQDAILGHARPWSAAEISDYIHSNFATELRSQDATISAVTTSDDGGGLSRVQTAPAFRPESNRDEYGFEVDDDSDDDEDFPSIETDVHQLARISRSTDHATPTALTRPAVHGDLVVDGGFRPTMPLVTLRHNTGDGGVTMPIFNVATAPMSAPPSAQQWLWPVLAIVIVAVGGALAWLVISRRPTTPVAPPVVIVQSAADNVAADAAVVPVVAMTATDAAAAVAPDSTDVTPPTTESGSTKLAQPPRVLHDDNEIAAAITGRLSAHKSAMSKCSDEHHGDLTGVDALNLTLQVSASGRATDAELAPASLAFTKAGTCILGVARSIDYGHFDRAVKFTLPIRVK